MKTGRGSSSWTRLIWSLLVGLLLTVGLAWTAMFAPHRNKVYGPLAVVDLGLVKTSDEHRIFQLSEGRNAWHHVVRYWHMQVSGMSLMIPIEDFESRRFDLNSLPRHLRPESVDEITMMAWYREVGFPFPALVCSIYWKTQVSNADIIYTVKGGVQLPRDKDFTPRAVPLQPVWPGFLGDLAIWSTLVWLMLWLATFVRMSWRRRRNCCINCGYLRTGLAQDATCPECGLAPMIHD